MKRILLILTAGILLFSCAGNPEEQIESSLKQIQSTLPKDLGSGVTYVQARYEKESRTIVFGYTVEGITEPFPPDALDVLKQVTLLSLNDPSVAADPIWKLAAKAHATFRYEYCLPDGSPAGSYSLSKREYAR